LTTHLDQGKWAAFSPASDLFASGRELATLHGHLTGVSAVAIAPDGRTLVSIEPQQGLRFWDLPTLREVAVVSLPSANEWLSFSPDGHTLAVGLIGGGIRLFKAPWSATCAQTKPPISPRTSRKTAFSHSQSWLTVHSWAEQDFARDVMSHGKAPEIFSFFVRNPGQKTVL
jgi:WD40 repeat protein